MFKNRDCPYCEHKFDDALDECPYCHNKVSEKTNKVSFVPWWKQITLFGIGLIGFQLLGFLLGFLIQTISRAVLNNQAAYNEFIQSAHYSALINFIMYGVIFVALTLVLFKDNIKLLKSFKHWTVPVSAIIGFVSILLFNLIYGSILKACGVNISDNENESLLKSIISLYPFLSILLFGIIGPICEEITYRVGFYSFFTRINKYLAYGLTIIVFAFIHFDFTATNIVNEFLNLPYYLYAAFVFCFLYEKFGFAASASAHITNNLFSIFGTIVLTFNK